MFVFNESLRATMMQGLDTWAELADLMDVEDQSLAIPAMRGLMLDLWAGSSFIETSADKFLAEQKCRLEPSHILPDSIGMWLQSETHVSEHRPWLNNVSTAIKRSLAQLVMDSLEDPNELNIRFYAAQSEGDDFENQPFAPQVREWWNRRALLDLERPRVPTNPLRNNTPFDFVEYVPLLSNDNLRVRLERLGLGIGDKVSRLEAWVPMDDPKFLQGRELEAADRHERFYNETLDFIHGLLAFDPGLSESRMAEIASWFSSVALDAWTRIPGFVNVDGADGSRLVPDGEAARRNSLLRAVLADLSDRYHDLGFDTRAMYWAQRSFNSGRDALLFNSPANFRIGAPTASDVQSAAVMRWMDFYRAYLQLLADASAGESHARVDGGDVPEHIRQGRLMDCCVVCGTDWAAMDPRHNYPVTFQPCGLRHAICMGCFKQISLQPAALNGRKCPICKTNIQYPLRTMTLRADLGLELELPALTRVAL
ncbi:hypothetical protein VSDG_08731 [Cytospora chrysosperma]|uniref:RING-type domain-containing protein n=1 Tax=Cytospora chrysosperma TaxID=252740 RepID=A0A423VDT0_CYTCH|nr:hypothetical protein VSDG_08731 [Valsa sordida]